MKFDNEKVNDPYYIGYNIMLLSLRDDKIASSISKAFDLAKYYMSANDIILYKLDEDKYSCVSDQPLENHRFEFLTSVLNKASKFLDKKEYLQLNISSSELDSLTLLPINFKEFKYVIAITNNKLKEDENKEFMGVLKESFTVVLEKLELYRKMKKNSKEDGLTGLDNRNSYNEKIAEINNNNDKYVFAIFDLFRLKYVNDNFSHSAGDDYIIKTAEILKKYFSNDFSLVSSKDIAKKNNICPWIFRIGGDEFVVISNSENLSEMKIKAELAVEEVMMIDLNAGQDLPLGLNYGISERKDNERVESLYLRADQALSKHKKIMYEIREINRRK